MEKITHQHGDLIWVEVKKIPKTAKEIPITENCVILLKGEGVNTHNLILENLSDAKLYQDGEDIYLQPFKAVVQTHIEHGKQVFAPGKIYKRRIEREFDYEKMEMRWTRD